MWREEALEEGPFAREWQKDARGVYLRSYLRLTMFRAVANSDVVETPIAGTCGRSLSLTLRTITGSLEPNPNGQGRERIS